MATDAYRLVVADALLNADLTQAQIIKRTGLGQATVSRWVKVLLDAENIHICRFDKHLHGGPDTAVYRRGAKPKGVRAGRPKATIELRSGGEWEHHLALRRAQWAADHPKRDALTTALFGPAP